MSSFEIFTSTSNALMLPFPALALAGVIGSTGPTGAAMLSGTGAPTGPCADGDSFIDLLTGDIYQCTGGAWTGPLGNFVGPTGSGGGGTSTGPDGGIYQDRIRISSSRGRAMTEDTYIDWSTGDIYECNGRFFHRTCRKSGNSHRPFRSDRAVISDWVRFLPLGLAPKEQVS